MGEETNIKRGEKERMPSRGVLKTEAGKHKRKTRAGFDPDR